MTLRSEFLCQKYLSEDRPPLFPGRIPTRSQDVGRKEFLERVTKLGIDYIKVLGEVKVKQTEVERLGVALCCTVAELFIASLAVLKSDAPNHAMTLLRSMIEAQVDLFALRAKREEYVKQMRLKGAKQLTQVFDAFLADPESGAQEDLTEGQAAVNLKTARKEFAALSAEGIKQPTVYERFVMADMESDYRSVYGFLCSSTHNDVNALAPRHFRESGLAVFGEMPAETLKSMTGLAISLLARSMRALQDFSEVSAERLDQAENAINSEWERISQAFSPGTT